MCRLPSGSKRSKKFLKEPRDPGQKSTIYIINGFLVSVFIRQIFDLCHQLGQQPSIIDLHSLVLNDYKTKALVIVVAPAAFSQELAEAVLLQTRGGAEK